MEIFDFKEVPAILTCVSLAPPLSVASWDGNSMETDETEVEELELRHSRLGKMRLDSHRRSILTDYTKQHT